MVRLAIYGDVNANIIDGSSVWLRNVSKLSLAHESAEVWLFLKAPIVRRQLLADLLDHPRLKVIEPSAQYLKGAEVMHPAQALSLIESHDAEAAFSAVVLRGMDLCTAVEDFPSLHGRVWSYITDIPQSLVDVERRQRLNLQKIVEWSKYVLCQTEELRSHFTAILDEGQSKLVLLPPVVPEEAFEPARLKDAAAPLRVLYSGKFAPAWATETLVDVFVELREEGHAVELHVAGDKFHRVRGDGSFADRMQRKLSTTDGVRWHGGLPQEEVFDLQKTCDVGFGWRLASMDGSLELSTKLLEYGASGLALIANPIPIHNNLLGEDYPLLVSSREEVKRCLRRLVQDRSLLLECAERAQDAARQHNLSSVSAHWRRLIDRVFHPLSTSSSPQKRLKVVLAGHDLKFSDELIEYFDARPDIELRIDPWHSLREHDEKLSKELLSWADVVFCEWCAGNAVWYSREIDSRRQSLLIRFHRFEINTEFPAQVQMDNVSRVLFVGPHFQQQAIDKFGWQESQCEMVPNFVDVGLYERPKFTGARFNLGLLGYVPKLKRLDRALDILRALRAEDPRYKLFVKGKHPWEYPWMWRNEEERTYFEGQMTRIVTDDLLNDAVVFDPFGGDVAHWLRKIGYILSVSDLESFHLAAAEGIASGAEPLFIEREGVSELFPWEHVHPACDEAAQFVLGNEHSWGDMEENRRQLSETYGVSAVRAKLDALVGPK